MRFRRTQRLPVLDQVSRIHHLQNRSLVCLRSRVLVCLHLHCLYYPVTYVVYLTIDGVQVTSIATFTPSTPTPTTTIAPKSGTMVDIATYLPPPPPTSSSELIITLCHSSISDTARELTEYSFTLRRYSFCRHRRSTKSLLAIIKYCISSLCCVLEHAHRCISSIVIRKYIVGCRAGSLPYTTYESPVLYDHKQILAEKTTNGQYT